MCQIWHGGIQNRWLSIYKSAYIFRHLCEVKIFCIFEKGHHANERIVSYICSLNEAVDKLKKNEHKKWQTEQIQFNFDHFFPLCFCSVCVMFIWFQLLAIVFTNNNISCLAYAQLFSAPCNILSVDVSQCLQSLQLYICFGVMNFPSLII